MTVKLADIPRYWKALVATLAPVYLAIDTAVFDDVVTQRDWVEVGVAVLAALGVLAVRNAPKPADRTYGG